MPYDPSQLIDLNAVRYLLRDILGCACPDDVFDHTVVGRPCIFPDTPSEVTVQALVGQRLLIDFIQYDSLKDNMTRIEQILMFGARQRDMHRLNRYRLVLFGPVDNDAFSLLQNFTCSLDDRVHIHAI